MAVTRGARRAAATPMAAAAGDAAATALFVLFSSLWGEAAARLAPAAGVTAFVAGLAVLGVGLAAFDPVNRAVGAALAGAPACFNPAHALALALAGRGGSFKHAGVRSAAQIAGAVAGAAAAARAVPARFVHALPTPVVTAPLKTAIITEVVLGAALSLVVIWASGAARSRAAALFAPLAATLVLTAAGGELAAHAPAFNPAIAAAWAWRPVAAKRLASHAAAFWFAPLAGAAIAAAIWRVLDEPVKKRPGAGAARAARAAKKRA